MIDNIFSKINEKIILIETPGENTKDPAYDFIMSFGKINQFNDDYNDSREKGYNFFQNVLGSDLRGYVLIHIHRSYGRTNVRYFFTDEADEAELILGS